MIRTARDRRAMTILGIGLVLLVTAYVLFFSGGRQQGTARLSGSPAVGAPLAGQPLSARSPLLIFSGRDPFLPLISSSPNPGPTVSPAGSPNSGGGSSASIGGHNVALDSIFSVNGSQKVQVEVDGHVYTVSVGGTFAGNFKLVSISGSCAGFTFGDQSFSLCLSANK